MSKDEKTRKILEEALTETHQTLKISTLRSRGFSIVQLPGPCTQLVHNDRAFRVNGNLSRFVSGRHVFVVSGWYVKEIPRDISLAQESLDLSIGDSK